MSRDELNAAYERISGRFPAEWPVSILAQAFVGRRETADVNLSARRFAIVVAPVDTVNYSLHVKAGGVDYVEIDVDLDDIESAADAIIEQIAAADMADPVKSRRGLDRLAAALQPAAGGTGRAA